MGMSNQNSTQKDNAQRFRIILTSSFQKRLEEATTKLISDLGVTRKCVKGPKRMPTQNLRIVTRKSPCGDGTSTFDNFEMRIHKRVIELTAEPEIIRLFRALPEQLVDKRVDIVIRIYHTAPTSFSPKQ